MKLTSMKRSESERRNDSMVGALDNVPDYPWGLQINLSEEDLQQLGIKHLPTAGALVGLEGVAKVTSTGEDEVDGKPQRRITLQITDLALAMPTSRTADRMYPEKA